MDDLGSDTPSPAKARRPQGVSRHAHPVFWLLDLAELMRDNEAATERNGSAPTHRPNPTRAKRATTPSVPWRLTFAVLDRTHGEVIECHELPAGLGREELTEWETVLGALDAAGRLRWSRLDRVSS